jgi:hypothetical protein
MWNVMENMKENCEMIWALPLHSRWLLLLKIEISSIVHCCFSTSQMSSNFNCSYMARSSLTYIPGISVKFFFQPIYTDYANWANFDKISHLNVLLWNHWTKLKQIWLGWSLGSPFLNGGRDCRTQFWKGPTLPGLA